MPSTLFTPTVRFHLSDSEASHATPFTFALPYPWPCWHLVCQRHSLREVGIGMVHFYVVHLPPIPVTQCSAYQLPSPSTPLSLPSTKLGMGELGLGHSFSPYFSTLTCLPSWSAALLLDAGKSLSGQAACCVLVSSSMGTSTFLSATILHCISCKLYYPFHLDFKVSLCASDHRRAGNVFLQHNQSRECPNQGCKYSSCTPPRLSDPNGASEGE